VTLVVAWAPFQARSSALAAALHGEARYVSGSWPWSSLVSLPLRYLIDAIRTWRLLNREQPKTVIAVTPPIFSALVGWLWCRRHQRSLVIDCHTGAFHSARWRWSRPILKALARRAGAALAHTETDEAELRSWGAPALLLPDDVPEPALGFPPPRAAEGRVGAPVAHAAPRIVVAGRLDRDEPVAAAIGAAAMTPEIEVRFTGDPSHLPDDLRRRAPNNAVFIGFVAWTEFMSELAAADAVAVLCTDPHIMSRAAFEAIGLQRPLILSDLPGLRGRFGAAALFCDNEPGAIAAAFRQALAERGELGERSRRLRATLKAQREAALDRLHLMLGSAPVQTGTLAAAR
jgi:glycosyltransferase involved in cell wall biosynthesis